MSLLLFALDPDAISQGRLFQMRKMFTEMVEYAEDEQKRYQISYFGSNMYGLIVQIQKVMGIQVDPKLPLRYEKAYERDKLSYISFFSSLEPFQDPDIKPCLVKALQYCDEYKFPRFHRARMNIEILTTEIELFSANLTDQANAQAKIDKLIKEIKESGDKDVIEVNLIAIYYTYLVFLESSNNTFKFLEIADSYLELAMKNCESPDFTSAIFQKTIYTLFSLNNYFKAETLTEKQLIFLEPFGTKSKSYADALYSAFIAKKVTNDLQFLVANVDILLESNKVVYGEKSPQYIEAVKEKAYSKMYLSQPQESYKCWLQAYDLSKEVFEGEVNNMAPGILLEMACIKSYLSQFEEALNLIDKAKKIEEKIHSIYSDFYKQIQQFEQNVLLKKENEAKIKKNKESFFRKLVPNTKWKISLFTAGIIIGTVGVYILAKNKRNS